jgi:hypothetical protein
MAIRDDSKYAEDNMDYKSKKDAMQKNNNNGNGRWSI